MKVIVDLIRYSEFLSGLQKKKPIKHLFLLLRITVHPCMASKAAPSFASHKSVTSDKYLLVLETI